jgi:hypothetical protein
MTGEANAVAHLAVSGHSQRAADVNALGAIFQGLLKYLQAAIPACHANADGAILICNNQHALLRIWWQYQG